MTPFSGRLSSAAADPSIARIDAVPFIRFHIISGAPGTAPAIGNYWDRRICGTSWANGLKPTP